jgi:hypothetical protein
MQKTLKMAKRDMMAASPRNADLDKFADELTDDDALLAFRDIGPSSSTTSHP